MQIYAWAFAGGLAGAVLMDITETIAARAGIHSGVNVALIGRWALGLRRGQLRHANIADSPALPGEVAAGWAFHFLVGGGAVALAYPALLGWLGVSSALSYWLGGPLFGLATSVLPWFLLLPCFGWGWFGRRGPQGANALLASTLSHLPYGMGVGALMTLGALL